MAITNTYAVLHRPGQMQRTVFNNGIIHKSERLNSRRRELERQTDHYERYQALQHAITQVIACSTELNVAIPRILQTICETISWDFGEVWHVDRDASQLYCETNWHNPTLRFPAFVKSGPEITFRPGWGLPGRVWAGEKPAWINDVVVDRNFLRASLAESEGLHAAFGIPIQAEGQIVGVMAFFSRRILTPDRDLMRTLETIGSQIGLFIKYKRMAYEEQQQAKKVAALEERQRLARDLHDSVTQTLFSANVMAELLPQIWNRDPDQVRSSLDELHALTYAALTEMRALLTELRQPVGQITVSADLSQRLKDLIEAVKYRSCLQITSDIQDTGSLSCAEQIALYRIVQEALNNVVKHARATHSWVWLQVGDAHFTLKIQDNGCGFDINHNLEGHLGLSIMQERAKEIGAAFDLISAPQHGTTITVSR